MSGTASTTPAATRSPRLSVHRRLPVHRGLPVHRRLPVHRGPTVSRRLAVDLGLLVGLDLPAGVDQRPERGGGGQRPGTAALRKLRGSPRPALKLGAGRVSPAWWPESLRSGRSPPLKMPQSWDRRRPACWWPESLRSGRPASLTTSESWDRRRPACWWPESFSSGRPASLKTAQSWGVCVGGLMPGHVCLRRAGGTPAVPAISLRRRLDAGPCLPSSCRHHFRGRVAARSDT